MLIFRENSKFTGLITVRTSSTRLPNKCLLPFGDDNVITHVVKRSISYGIEPIICTSADPSDDILETIANNLNIKFFRGSLNNKLKRWLDCAEEFGLKDFHTIDADDPLFDGDQMKKSLNLLRSRKCDIICPTESSSSGGASVGYSLTKEIVEKALVNVADDTDTEMMWYFLEKIKGIKMEILPETDDYRMNARLTLDYEEDYWLLASIVRILGNDATRQQINDLFLRNPDLIKLNLFRNDEWKKSQLLKKI